jgi:hypothetical protein
MGGSALEVLSSIAQVLSLVVGPLFLKGTAVLAPRSETLVPAPLLQSVLIISGVDRSLFYLTRGVVYPLLHVLLF